MRSPRLLLISNSWTPSKTSDRSSSRIIRTILLPKNSHILTQILRELILISKPQMILSVTKSFIHSESKYKHIKLSFSPKVCSKEYLQKSSLLYVKVALYIYKTSFQQGSKEHEFLLENQLKNKKRKYQNNYKNSLVVF